MKNMNYLAGTDYFIKLTFKFHCETICAPSFKRYKNMHNPFNVWLKFIVVDGYDLLF
jgi:hypothetical protein